MRLIRVRGRSMTPSLRPGQILLVADIPSGPGSLSRGDVVFLKNKSIKRLLGLPGESVEVSGDELRVDGRVIHEPYLFPRCFLEPKPDARWVLGPGEFIVLGDARDDSLDSRSFGPVRASEILGKVVLKP